MNFPEILEFLKFLEWNKSYEVFYSKKYDQVNESN